MRERNDDVSRFVNQQNRPKKRRTVTARLDPTNKAKLEVLAECYYDGSQADVIRTWINDHYDQIFGDIHPRALLSNHISDEVVSKFCAHEKDPNELVDDLEIDEKLRLNEDEEVTQAVGDGGVVAQPTNYNATLGPSELRESGPALDWEGVREIVDDHGHWSDSLEIHPGRIPADELKSNHKLASRVVVAIARHEAVDGIVFEHELQELVDTYLRHLSDRADPRAAKEYIRSTYLPLVKEHLYPHPDPRKEFYYTNREQYASAVQELVADPFTSLNMIEAEMADVLDRSRFRSTYGFEHWSTEVQKQYRNMVGDWLGDLATLWTLHSKPVHDLGRFENQIDYPDNHDNLAIYLLRTVQNILRSFDNNLANRERSKILEHHTDDVVEEIIGEINR